ncbi:unnamed protein product [Brachionus calyciflorus]|uniref:Peptidase A2 domain-containing protein n=1 Tax=Brachionus calyciflorus TaxID=104777 RepID=A0A814J0B6_9BILA|nr:unnamed protein product [Brachionus calyciflorus]
MSGSKQETTEQMAEQNDDTIQPVGSNVVPHLSSGSEAQENASKSELNKLKKDQLVDLACGLNKTVADIRNTSASLIAKTSKATPTDPLTNEVLKKMNHIAKFLANEPLDDLDPEGSYPKMDMVSTIQFPHIDDHNTKKEYKNKTVPVCKTSNDSILSIVGFVNGTPVKLALDSGAVESIISNKIVERLGLKIYESNVQVKTATDVVKKVLGETEDVNVDIEGHTCRMSFLVLDMEDYEVPGHTVRLLKDDSKYETFDDMVDVLLIEVVDEVDIEDESDWETQEIKFEPSIPLDSLQLKQCKRLMKKYRDMFALRIEDLGECADRVIRQSKSAWSAPVIMIPKKDGTKRMSIDYRITAQCSDEAGKLAFTCNQ